MTEQELCRALERLNSKPNDALVSAKLGAIFLECSERTLRYHPLARRIYITPTRYNYQLGNLRQIARSGVEGA
jgi:hypothetical protein